MQIRKWLPVVCALFAVPAAMARSQAQQPAQAEMPAARIGDVPFSVSKPRTSTKQAPQAKIAEPMYDLPFLADDLNSGERFFVGKKIHSSSGSQMWGYDLGLMKLDDASQTWAEVKPGTNWKAPTNANFYVYGKPVYAMGPGKVIACWRNAPENPRPFSSELGDEFTQPFKEQKWLHPSWRDEMMSGAGNHLLVEETDGDLVLYAHAQTGSISSSLCPHDAVLYSKAKADGETNVPPAQQVTIQAGELLFLTGNSGNSSKPHLHVHKQTADGGPIQMQFRRGLSTPVTSNGTKADVNKWTRFAGQRIPDGPVLLWPPRKRVGEYARHRYPASDYQRLFDHLSDSGFWPEWIDGYSVDGKPFLNFVWRPAQGTWRSFALLSPQDYQARFKEADKDGYAPVLVESSLVNGEPRYSAIFVKDKPGGALARHGLTTAEHDALLLEAKKLGMSPVNVSVISIGGERRYTSLFRTESIGVWQLRSQVPEAEYQELFNANDKAGRRPVYVNAYLHDGERFYTVIFSQKPAGSRKDKHGMSANTYETEAKSALAAGQLTRAVSGFDGASDNHHYIAVWRK